jgi:hypothetical protein
VSEHNRAVVIRPDVDPGGGAVASSKPGRQAPTEVAQLVMGDPLRRAAAIGAATPAPFGNNGRSRPGPTGDALSPSNGLVSSPGDPARRRYRRRWNTVRLKVGCGLTERWD